MKPIEEFKTQEELIECLKWWQRRLYLDSWLIEAELVDMVIDVDGDDIPDAVGHNSFVYESEMSKIQILKKENYDCYWRYCAEKILVHEILHCKYNWMQNQDWTYESAYVDAVEHKLLEQMAKSLIMAKYDLDLNYFQN